MKKTTSMRALVHKFATDHADSLQLGNYQQDSDLFESMNPNLNIPFATFKYYLREMTDPTFSKYIGGKLGDQIIAKSSVKVREAINLFSLKKYNPDPKLFIPMKTKKPIDLMMSLTGGFMPGTTIMLDGGPGTGKTTTGTDSLVSIQRNNSKIKSLYLNSEMKPLDLAAERLERKSLNDLDNILLLSEYKDMKHAIEDVLAMGWDFVLIDSMDHICRRLKNQGVRNPEEYMLELFAKHNDDFFKTGHYTTFLVIQQVTKGGVFKGSNDQKHDTTAFIHAEFDEEGKRYLWAEKNRRNGRDVNRKLYYSLENGEVVYDEDRWKKDQLLDVRALEEKEMIKKEDKFFESMFLSDDKMVNPKNEKKIEKESISQLK